MNGTRHEATAGDQHEWVRQRLAPMCLSLLGDGDEAKMTVHLESCPECSERYRLILESCKANDAGKHIPAGLIARWSGKSARLRGIERAMVGRHLEHCEKCRADLEFIGFEPKLMPEVAEQQDTVGQVVSLARAGQARKANHARSLNWWMTGSGWAVAATLTVVLLRSPATMQVAQGPEPGPSADSPPTQVAVVTDPAAMQGNPPEPAGVPEVEHPEISARPRGFQAGTDHVRRPRSRTGAGMGYATTERLGKLRGGIGEIEATQLVRPRAGFPVLLFWDGSFKGSSSAPVRFAVAGPAGYAQKWTTTLGELDHNPAVQLLPIEEDFAPGLYVIKVVMAAFDGAEGDSLQMHIMMK